MRAIPCCICHFKKQGKKVVPLNIELKDNQRILIVSGPNAGGKSVSLKTVGLIQYMFQCGLLVPVAGRFVHGLFSRTSSSTLVMSNLWKMT
jgi:DNA mismatch repair protein MutS2